MSATFKISNKEVLDRIKSIEQFGMMKGVLDERGKYICLEEEEIKAMLRMIEEKGRLTRAELVEEFSKLIRLDPSEEGQARIQKQDEELKLKVDREFVSCAAELPKN